MSLAAKLQIKPGQPLRVLHAPAGFALDDVPAGDGGAVLLFVKDAAELEAHAAPVWASALADRLTWVAYPKAGKLGTDLNRDRLADLARRAGVQPVRNVAIDETWSALRFRPG